MRRGGLRITAGGRRRVLWAGAIVAALALLAGAALAYALGTAEGLRWCVMHAPHRYLRRRASGGSRAKTCARRTP
ncbi:MAG: hypothetical protein M5R40_18525 [Anaerolineae bacterium]|nr:hypothetical protein [Anaerolineae bacterium]